ncbi:hypothetical protein Bca4012_052458 [Brassica carinata]|uniref:Uncharacterized protein n=1 Tax=Brassica carinata TaxID=52824 RepID=A0A8X7R9Q8_BRACI|nr:hypothetical protein Bca52824_054987 [Brassica carinata]
MGRPPCCDKSNVKKGHWTAEEDAKILTYVAIHGVGNWSLVPKKAASLPMKKSLSFSVTESLAAAISSGQWNHIVMFFLIVFS